MVRELGGDSEQAFSVSFGEKAPQVTHQSYAERGLDKVLSHHLGSGATAMERRRERSAFGDLNRASRATNERLKEIRLRQDAWSLQRQYSPPVNRSVADVSVDLIGVADNSRRSSRGISSVPRAGPCVDGPLERAAENSRSF